MRKTAFILALLTGCASGPQPVSTAPSTAPSAASRLESDRAVAATLRSVAARARRGEAAQVRAQYDAEAKQRPNDWRPKLFSAWAGQPSEAAWQEIALLSKMNPEEPWPWTASALIYLQWKGFLDQAEGDLTRALKARPGFVPALVGRADLLRLRGKLPEAKAAYEAVLVGAPGWQEALSGLGLTQLAMGDAAGGRATLDQALAVDSEDLAAIRALARLALESKDVPRTLELYSKMLRYDPRDRGAHLALAQMKAGSGDAEGAAQSYEAAMAIAPDLVTALALADSYRALKRGEDEARLQEKVAQLDAKATAPLLRLAELSRADGDSEAAEAALRRAVERAPEDPALRLELARLLAERDDAIEAIEAYRTAQAKGAADAAEPLAALQAKLGLGKPIKGDPNRVYAEVFARLHKRFLELQKKTPGLGGRLRARVTIGEDGKASQVELIEDTVHEASLTGLVYFSLKDAQYPRKSTPTFEFVLSPAKK